MFTSNDTGLNLLPLSIRKLSMHQILVSETMSFVVARSPPAFEACDILPLRLEPIVDVAAMIRVINYTYSYIQNFLFIFTTILLHFTLSKTFRLFSTLLRLVASVKEVTLS